MQNTVTDIDKKSALRANKKASAGLRYVVVGSGPVGVRFVRELLSRQSDADVLLIGNEEVLPYNRVLLTALLSGEVAYDNIGLSLPNKAQHPNFQVMNMDVVSLDMDKREICDRVGVHYPYDRLIFATGARPFVPQIKGTDQSGVFTFRSLKDTEKLLARTSRARHVVIMGGGLLGLEAAKAMLRANTQVTVIQQGSRLLNRQLDEAAATVLQKKVEALGINVITQTGVREIQGQGRVTAVMTRDKQVIECDTVLLCTGISPNIELAIGNVAVRKGIVVDDQLKTSNDSIYAIGECCEHEGATYGLVSPGYEQAAVLADHLCGGSANYAGSLEVSRLKVVGESVISMGDVTDLNYQPFQREISYRKGDQYRKIVLRKGVIAGAVGIGDWPQAKRVQENFLRQEKINLWRQWYFNFTGRLWVESDSSSVTNWSDQAIVCQCNSISKGEIAACIQQGTAKQATCVSDVTERSGAGSVCGSCKPLVQELFIGLTQQEGATAAVEKEHAWFPTAIASVIAVIIAAIVAFAPALAVSETVQKSAILEFLWNDHYWKQVTGFSLLGMSIVGLLLSLRKRMKKINFGQFSQWRFAHIFLGVACAVTLILHTGMHLGENLNQILMIDFLLVLILGGIAGTVVSLSHQMNAKQSMQVRKFFSWVHILVTWPLPALLGIHILTVYYY